MDIGTILLLLTFILILSDIFLLLFHAKIQNWQLWDNIILYIASITIFGAFFEFIMNLIVQDYSYTYVTSYSSIEMDIPLRIGSSWSGASGSFFLWTIFMFTGFLIFRYLFRKMMDQQIYRFASIIQGVNLLAFLLFILIKDPFAINAIVPTEGNGLNPLLATFLNLIHPPIVFIAYSIFVIPFSIALAKLITGLTDNDAPAEIQKFLRLTMALGWLILGTGILIGGYWAYTTLGWGGFWAWDPVETGSLIPWLFALVFFHGSPVFKSDKGNFGKDLIATFPFLSVLFATIVTRTGLLSSVHAFGVSVSDYIIIVYLIILLITILYVIAPFRIKIQKDFGINISKYPMQIKFFYSIEELKIIKRQDAALYISFFSFLLGTIAIMTGLIIPLVFALLPEPFNQSFIVDKKYFNIIIGLFGFGALEAAFFTDFVFIKTDNKKLTAITFGVMLGFINVILNLPIVNFYLSRANIGILYNLLHILGTTSLLANFILPILILSLVILLITVYKFYTSNEMQKQVKMRKISQTFLHLGIVIALIGALISYNTTYIGDVLLTPNSSDQSKAVSTTQNVNLTVIESIYEHDSATFSQKLHAHVKLVEGNTVLGEGILEYTNYFLFGVIVNVIIISSLTSDYYLTIMTFTVNNANNGISDIRFQIRIIPMINFLWLGASIVLASMVILVVISLRLFIFSYRKAGKHIATTKNTTLLKNIPIKGVV